MKSLWKFIAIVVTVGLSSSNLSAQFYYSHNQQLPLKIDSSKISIKFFSTLGQDDQSTIINR